MPDTLVMRDGGTVYVQADGDVDPAAGVCVNKIDWLLLAQQKHRLLHLIWEDDDDILWGLIHLIDAIQDRAEEDGLPVVFFKDAWEWDDEHA